ncbi:selenocysteine lyase [Halobacteriovorax marinus]|uniref:Selenocysteine lyase n=1 Tax=Halobacteriovorax marinus TaxID=97084 RepID=A0A1Y5F7A6_9BACT|nr:selenocysteine lyase [Halobacteriovorax marinus]
MNKYQKYFSKFLAANAKSTHFACHSHHYWPDCTYEAQKEYWNDSCKYVDDKWEHIFSKKIPKVQKLISKVLDFDRPADITFAPNTHELVYRILSSFDKKIKILTTDSEFYSFSRQLSRLIEADLIEATIVKIDPIENFEERFLAASEESHDLVFISQVFFNSGIALRNFTNFTKKLIANSEHILIDGYHAFMAVPTSLKEIGDKIFYIAGSYKYAAGGEGCCFMTIPKDCSLRPKNTGWFADISTLDNNSSEAIDYPNDGMRFAGSTMDFSALYRLTSILELYEEETINVEVIHKHVQSCQKKFLDEIKRIQHPKLNIENLIFRGFENHGHFLTFELKNSSEVSEVKEKLKKIGMVTDSRENRLRFGFSIYHDGKYRIEI